MVILAASIFTNATLKRVIAIIRFVHQRQTQNNTPLSSIQEEEDVTEATPVGELQDYDGILDKQQGEDEHPIPHFVEDVQEILRTRSVAQPVGLVRKNAVRQ